MVVIFDKTALLVLFVIVVVLLMLPCLVSLLQRALQRTAQAILVAQIKKGGIMGDWAGLRDQNLSLVLTLSR